MIQVWRVYLCGENSVKENVNCEMCALSVNIVSLIYFGDIYYGHCRSQACHTFYSNMFFITSTWDMHIVVNNLH